MSMIRLENLVKRFGAFTALKTMDLTIADGEFVALLGPSGCGKSTTMNMIAGMETPSEGRILFGDRDMAGVPMGRRGVGFVFQNYAIFTHMTVRQNLSYGLRATRRPADEVVRRTNAMAELLQLTPMLDRPAAGLSPPRLPVWLAVSSATWDSGFWRGSMSGVCSLMVGLQLLVGREGVRHVQRHAMARHRQHRHSGCSPDVRNEGSGSR